MVYMYHSFLANVILNVTFPYLGFSFSVYSMVVLTSKFSSRFFSFNILLFQKRDVMACYYVL